MKTAVKMDVDRQRPDVDDIFHGHLNKQRSGGPSPEWSSGRSRPDPVQADPQGLPSGNSKGK